MELLRINESKDSPVDLYYNHKIAKYKVICPKNDNKATEQIEQWLKVIEGVFQQAMVLFADRSSGTVFVAKKQGGKAVVWQCCFLHHLLKPAI